MRHVNFKFIDENFGEEIETICYNNFVNFKAKGEFLWKNG